MRDLDIITKHIVHCSDSTFGDAETIDKWHKERGWNGIGYHFVILPDGTVECGRDWKEVGAHCKGENRVSIGTCLIGKDTFTSAQMKALAELDKHLKLMFPNMKTYGHRDFSHKPCPNFNVKQLFN